MLIQGQIGPQQNADSGIQPIRMGKQGEASGSALHGRYYEQTYRGNVYAAGGVSTVLVALNSTGTLDATSKPIIGVWNPPNSGVNLVILEAGVITTVVAGSATNSFGFQWCASPNQTGISTGSAPVNKLSLQAAGSKAKFFAMTTALTGLTGNMTQLNIPLDSPANTATASSTSQAAFSGQCVQKIDGSLFCPPGSVLAVYNSTSGSGLSAQSYMMWEEVPV